MTAERPIAAPLISPEAPRTVESLKPVVLSPDTVVASAKLAQKSSEASASPKDVKEVVNAVAGDLHKEGIDVTPADVQSAVSRMSESPPASPSGEKPKQERPVETHEPAAIDLDEYWKAVGDIFQTYQLGSGKWWLMSGIYSGNIAARNILDGYVVRANKDGQLIFRMLDGVVDAVKEAGATTGGDLLKKSFVKDLVTNKKAMTVLRDATWPIWSQPLSYLVENVTGRYADNLFFKEQQKLQQSINTRITRSILMRDFEFLHDKPVEEMINIIDRGKASTANLVVTTYADMLPLLVNIGSILQRQGIVDKKLSYAAWAKSILIGTNAWVQAKDYRNITTQEREMWNLANTRLAATLGNLETVRTSGGAQESMKRLATTLEDRDTILSGGLRKHKTSTRWVKTVLDLIDNAPFAIEGVNLYKNIRKDPRIPVGDVLLNMYGKYNMIADAKMVGQDLQSSIMQLTNLYTYQVIPALEDIKRMNDLLGPYDVQEMPNGPREQKRIAASKLPNYDIKVSNVSFKDILHNVSLDIPQGSFVTVKGPSGIGKSTLFREMIGLYAPQGGGITYGGVPVSEVKRYGDDSLYNAIGYANQSPQVMDGMTLRENLLLWTKKDISDDKVQVLLKDLKLDHLAPRLDTAVKHFSGGELRRIGIARALLKDPKILFLDEPTANLDQASAQQVLAIIQELRKTRPDMTVVAITHDPVFEKIAEKVVDFEKLNKSSEMMKLGDHQVLEAMAKPS